MNLFTVSMYVYQAKLGTLLPVFINFIMVQWKWLLLSSCNVWRLVRCLRWPGRRLTLHFSNWFRNWDYMHQESLKSFITHVKKFPGEGKTCTQTSLEWFEQGDGGVILVRRWSWARSPLLGQGLRSLFF